MIFGFPWLPGPGWSLRFSQCPGMPCNMCNVASLGSQACKIFCRFHFWTSPQTFSELTRTEHQREV